MNQIVTGPLHGEVLGDADSVRVVAALHPLRSTRVEIRMPAGLSIAEMIAALPVLRLPHRLHATIDGDLIPPELHGRVRPKAGHTVTLVAVPQGGKGGVGQILMIAVAVLALVVTAGWAAPVIGSIFGATAGAAFAAGTLGASLLGAAISVGGALLVQALFPPPKPKKEVEPEQRYSIGGGRNGASPYGTVPATLGFHRMQPLYAAKPYTEIIGDDQYLRMLFVWGYGPVDISDLRIGTTPIGQYNGVEIETRLGYPGDAGITLMPQEAFEEALNVELQYGQPITRTSAADVDEISWDVTFPGGLYATYSKNGAQLPMAVSYRFSYRPVGSGSWIVALDTQAYENRKDAFRRGFRLPVSRGQYEMMAERTSPKGQNVNSSAVETLMITAMRSSRNEYPLRFNKPIAVTAIRILASSQLNGAIDSLNGLVRSYVKSWLGSAWVANTLSNNPADLFRHVLQSAPNARPVSDSRIDLAALQGWAMFCKAKGFAYNKVVENAASVVSLLDEICAAGRAVRVFTDGKWSVIWDRDDLPVVQHFSPRNSRDFSGRRQYLRMPHGFRVKFLNETKNYEQDERVVYDDGYTKANATLFEAIEFPGITNPDLIWKHGRFHIAQVRLRPEIYKLTVDFENLVCTRGDRVRVTHDIPLWGQISARVTEVNGYEVTLDEWVVMEAGKNYVARFRLEDGTSVLHNVSLIPGEHKTILLSADAPMPAIGDLMLGFGELGRESVVLRVLRIEPGADMAATLTLVDDAPAISQADTGAIPAFDSMISAPVNPLLLAPSDLVVTERLFTAGGDVRAGARISWRIQRSGFAVSYEVQIRDDSVSDADWRPVGAVAVPQTSIDTGELPPGTYSFRVRSLFGDRTNSDWQQQLFVAFQGLNALPPDVTGFRFSSLADVATLQWDAISLLNLDHFEIRYSPLLDGVTWGSAGTIVPGATGTQVQIPNRVGTYLIKAVTRQEQFSQNPAIITSTIAQLANTNVVEAIEEAPAFAGAKTGVEKVGSFLQLAAPGGVMTTTGTYVFAGSVDLGAVFTSRLTPTVDAFGASLSDVMASWATLADVEALASADPSSWNVRVEYRATNDAPAANTWSVWTALAITDLTARAFQFRAILTGTATGSVTPVVRGLTVEVDMPDRVEAGNDILVGTSGYRVEFVPPFKVLRGIAIAVQDRASGDREQITDKDEGGFTLRFFNSGGSAVARTVDFVAKGYGRVES